MPRKIIDDNFIKEWSLKFDKDTEEKYKKIIEMVRKEVSSDGTISKDTFESILHWKASRLKGIVKLDKFDDYAERIKQALQAPEYRKLSILDDLYGIGVPVASTILHFIYS